MSEFKTRLHSVPSGGFLTDRDKDKKPILDVRELGIDFGGLTAVDNFNLMIGRNEIAGLIAYLPEHPLVQGAERHRQHQGGSARVHEV